MRTALRVFVALAAGAFVLAVLPSAVVRAALSGVAAPDSFTRDLVQAAAQLDQAAAGPRSVRRARVVVPDIRLPQSPVETERGAPSLDHWLQSQLQRIRGEKSARARSREMRDLAAALRHAAQPQSETSPSQDPHAAAAAILLQKAYQTGGGGAAPAPRKSILEEIVDWILGRLGDLFRRLFGATASIPMIGQIVAVLFIALIAAVAGYLIFVLVSLLMRRTRSASINEGTPLPQSIDPDALYERCVAAAARGQYAQAAALLFQTTLVVFDRSGKLPYDASLTAGEYRRAVRRSLGRASSPFDAIARTFVLAAFAERPITKDEFAAADLAYRELRPLVAA